MRTVRSSSLALVILALFAFAAAQLPAFAGEPSQKTFDHGAIVRGDLQRKRIALIFTGGDYGEGTAPILDNLRSLHVKAGFFVTGDYLRKPESPELLRRALREGHYVGPHSDRHLLYCPWDAREKSLVSETQFREDLQKNIDDLVRIGVRFPKPIYFIPPYEWFNRDQTKWAEQMGVQMFNFSPGSGSNRDYLPESDNRFVSSQALLQGILDYEKKDPHGMNGYILLLHLGADRQDKMYRLLEPLVGALRQRGYEFARIDEMLGERASQ